MSHAFKKYLQRYAEPEVNLFSEFPSGSVYDNVVVIPAYKESPDFLQQFTKSDFGCVKVLVILVINQPDDETDRLPQQHLYQAAVSMGNVSWQHRQLTLIDIEKSQTDLLIVDRFSVGVPRKKAVGLARKIGVDCACILIDKSVVQSAWIHSTDADATLPVHYFSATSTLGSEWVGGCYGFTHACKDTKIQQANEQYELSLRYYVAGLKYANSPYSFFTIGSILTFTAQAYANVRGFPKKSAGEDFYLLNKLAKIGKIACLSDVEISLKARVSDRVPFGTGPAVNKILQNEEQGGVYHYYHPDVFVHLKALLTSVEQLYVSRYQLQDWLSKSTLR